MLPINIFRHIKEAFTEVDAEGNQTPGMMLLRRSKVPVSTSPGTEELSKLLFLGTFGQKINAYLSEHPSKVSNFKFNT